MPGVKLYHPWGVHTVKLYHPWGVHTESGASDARFLVNPKIPAILTSAYGGGDHTENEWVSLKSLTQLQNVLLKFCHSLKSAKKP